MKILCNLLGVVSVMDWSVKIHPFLLLATEHSIVVWQMSERSEICNILWCIHPAPLLSPQHVHASSLTPSLQINTSNTAHPPSLLHPSSNTHTHRVPSWTDMERKSCAQPGPALSSNDSAVSFKTQPEVNSFLLQKTLMESLSLGPLSPHSTSSISQRTVLT